MIILNLNHWMRDDYVEAFHDFVDQHRRHLLFDNYREVADHYVNDFNVNHARMFLKRFNFVRKHKIWFVRFSIIFLTDDAAVEYKLKFD